MEVKIQKETGKNSGPGVCAARSLTSAGSAALICFGRLSCFVYDVVQYECVFIFSFFLEGGGRASSSHSVASRWLLWMRRARLSVASHRPRDRKRCCVLSKRERLFKWEETGGELQRVCVTLYMGIDNSRDGRNVRTEAKQNDRHL